MLKKNLRDTLLLILIFIISSANLTAQEQLRLNRQTEQTLLIASTGLTLATAYFHFTDKMLTPSSLDSLNADGINRFDRSAVNNWSPRLATISDVGLIFSITAPALLFLSPHMSSEASTYSLVYAETLFANLAVMGIAKTTIRRLRPYAYNVKVPQDIRLAPAAKRSFFSGHTSLAFGSAVFTSTLFDHYYPESSLRPWVWGSSLAIASGGGYLRYAAGKHFPTDIIVGAVVGSAIGYVIPKLHKQKPREAPNGLVFSFNFILG